MLILVGDVMIAAKIISITFTFVVFIKLWDITSDFWIFDCFFALFFYLYLINSINGVIICVIFSFDLIFYINISIIL